MIPFHRVTNSSTDRRDRTVFSGATLAGALVLAFALVSAGESVMLGSLTQLDGTAGCVSESGTGGLCTGGVALNGAFSVAVSPGGKHVYVTSQDSKAVAAFSRHKATGALTQLAGTAGCVSEDGSGGLCTDGVALDIPQSVTISPDGKHIYVASFDSDAVAVLSRNKATGALTPLAGTGGVGTDGARSVAVSPDGKHVYVASSDSSAVAVFSRNKATGALTQLAGTAGCVSDTGTGGLCTDGVALDLAFSVTVSPDGKHVYVASIVSGAVAVFSRNKATGALTQLLGTAGCLSEDGTGGACTDGKALVGARSVAVSPDGRHVYVASGVSHAVAVFSRNKGTGALTQLAGTLGCVSKDGTGGDCTDGTALAGANFVTVSRDGRNVYVASSDCCSGAVAVFSRNKATGALAQLAGTLGCVSEDGTGGACTNGKALVGALSVTVSRDGKNVYVVSAFSDAVAVFTRD